ncbi:MAG: hypothetical protein J0L69_12980 [Bacteroidetes bacterium]|nr:hypothetical protein [Bacteroidota bacterium]
MRYFYLVVVCLLTFTGISQSNQDFKETDKLESRAVLYIPTADNDKLALIKNEFAKYPQIQSAVYFYHNHNALLIEFADVVNPMFFTYSDIIKLIAHGIPSEEVWIKTPAAYDEILSNQELDTTKFILK